MPFTLAHPAAAVPLLRVLGRYGVLSALVVGSLMPDISYFFPFEEWYAGSHSLLGLFWFCLPVGLLSYVAFHIFLKGPLLGLVPVSVFSRCGVYAENYRSLPLVSWVAVIASLLVGSMTHLVWDSFTHKNTWMVNFFSVLQYDLFSVGSYHVYLFKIFQHLSTVFGVTLMGWWVWHHLKLMPKDTRNLPVMLSILHRYLVVLALVLIPLCVGALNGISVVDFQSGAFDVQAFAGKVVFSSMKAFFLALVVYCVGWHLRRLCW